MRPGGASAARAAQATCDGAKLPLARFAFEADAQGDSGLDKELVQATIEQGCITLEKWTGMAAAQKVRVPISSYRGIALALGEQSVLTLLHEVPDFCVKLAVYDPLHDNENILAEGEGWAEALGCKLLIEQTDGNGAASEMQLASRRPRARRANSFFAARRPGFLTKRASGGSPATAPIRGAREIIART
ncbi:MAG: DUF6101 family protein [Pseudomonadota bacterium]